MCGLRKLFFCLSPHHSSRFLTIAYVSTAVSNMVLQKEWLAKAEEIADQVNRNMCEMNQLTYFVFMTYCCSCYSSYL